MDRRLLLKTALPLGLAGLGLRHVLLPPRRSAALAPVRDLTARLIDGLDAEQRAAICSGYDSPWRQYHNRGVWCGGLRAFGSGLSRSVRGTLTDLFHAGLSERGRELVPNQYFVNWPGVHLLNVQVFGDPREGPYQVILSGPHLNLRLGGASAEGAAFGGPQVWGEQRSDGVPGMPRNRHRAQFAAGQAVIAALPKALFEDALLPTPPVQTDIEPRGPAGPFPGASVSEFPPQARAAVRALVDSIFGLWPDADAAFAGRCLDAGGGLEALHFAAYEEGAAEGYFPVFRLEGPNGVIHFRGWPHLHAFCHVTLDGARPLSVGEPLGENPVALEGRAAAELFERALVSQTGADLGVYPTESVAARLRAGPVRTGDIYTLESWLDRVALVTLAPDRLVPDLARRLDADQRSRAELTVATTDHVASELLSSHVGAGRRSAPPGRPSVRDALLAHVRAHGFTS